MKIIGITGPTGAGKSLLCQALAKRVPVIDADEVYHSLLIPPSECLDALRQSFGDGIFFPNGTLNRPALSKIVFSDEEKLSLLNRTVLDFVLQTIRAQIAVLESKGETAVIVDAPTLIESGFHRECALVVSVLASPELRRSRIMTRDTISEEKANLRISAQKDDAFYREYSDLVLVNNGDADQLLRNADEILNSL